MVGKQERSWKIKPFNFPCQGDNGPTRNGKNGGEEIDKGFAE